MIPQDTVNRILDAAQVVDVVGDFVTLKKRGANYIACCPFHNEKTPSFVVSPAKGMYKCFGCGKGGNAIGFVMEHENVSFPEALRIVAKRYGIEVEEKEQTEEDIKRNNDRESMFAVNSWAAEYFVNFLHNDPEGLSVGMSYFRQRGFRDDIIKKFQLGFSTESRDALFQEAKKKGFNTDYLVKTGLCYTRDDGQVRDRFWGRVMFPVHTLSGKVVAFGGRVLKTDSKVAKYVNSPESEIYHKSRELYGIYFAKQAIVKQDKCFLVEGYTDVISMHQAGVENVVASSGTSLTSGQIRMIHRFTNNITVLYDGDMAGIKASIRGIDMLLEEGMNIKVMLLPDGDDPDSFARKHNATEFQEYIAAHEVDFIRFKTNLLMSDAANDPYKRATLITDIVKSISVIPEAIVRSEYIKECSQMLHVEEKLLVNEVAKMKRAEEEKKTKSSTSSSQEEKSRSDAPQASPTSQATNQAIEYTDIPPISVQDLPPMGVDDVTEQGWSTHDAATPANTPLIDFNSVSPLYSQERLIIQQLIRYGERTIYKDDESGRDVSVIEYLNADLANDGITLTTPLFDQLLKESLQHVYDEGFTAERYFIAHADAQISRLAADLVEEKYQLSKYHSNVVDDVDRLNDIIPHLLNDYKMSIIEQNLKEILNDLRQPSTMNDPVKCQETMLRYKQLMELKQRMAKILGDRVIGM